MEPLLRTSDLRAFIDRRWDLVQREKLRFAVDRLRNGGSTATRTAARRLLERYRALHPEPASVERRADDLASHVALKKKLDQASDALVRR